MALAIFWKYKITFYTVYLDSSVVEFCGHFNKKSRWLSVDNQRLFLLKMLFIFLLPNLAEPVS